MSKVDSKNKFFKGNTPPAPIEFDLDDNGNKINKRRVNHVRTGVDGRQYRYHATKGWKVIPEFNSHSLLNNLFTQAGYGTIYSSRVLHDVYGLSATI